MPPAYPAFGLPFCPLSPQPPSPPGKGENITLFRRGLRPRHPCIKPFAALIVFAAVVPSGGLVPSVAVSAGVSGTLRVACPLCRPPTLPLVCCFAPYPPNPLPRRGRGRFFCFLMQGASPLASPAFNRLRHLQSLPLWYPEGGLPPALPSRRALTVPCGGLVLFAARLPCLWFDFLPPSPQPPSPAGKGENITLFRRGLRPRHPCIKPFAALTVPAAVVPSGRNLRFAAKPTGSGSL